LANLGYLHTTFNAGFVGIRRLDTRDKASVVPDVLREFIELHYAWHGELQIHHAIAIAQRFDAAVDIRFREDLERAQETGVRDRLLAERGETAAELVRALREHR
jgi:hypothetical protein